MAGDRSAQPLLDVSGLRVELTDGTVIVDGVDLRIGSGEIVGIVGESGAGKSMTALAVVQMLPRAARIAGGRVMFAGRDLAGIDPRTLRQLRGGQVGMVFQDPLSSLNPVMTVGSQIEEALRLHGVGRREASARTAELLGLVGISEPQRSARSYPHEFSGGMRQRVMIAIAVANNPRLVIADEPTTGLDVTIQAEVLALLMRLRDELGLAVMLITHDIGVVEEVCDRVTVLYGGRVVETGGIEPVFASPEHPYTFQLIQSAPRVHGERTARLPTIPGAPAAAADAAFGCPFAPRCAYAEGRCREAAPPLVEVGAGRAAACWVTAAGDVTLSHVPPAAGPGPAPAHDHHADGPGRAQAPDDAVISVVDLKVRYRAAGRRTGAALPAAVDGVTLAVPAGRVLGLIGESGSGKTSVARAMLGLVKPAEGTVTVNGIGWESATRQQAAEMRRTVQLVFQDSLASMDPRWRVRQIISEPIRNREPGFGLSLERLLESVGLDRRLLDRYPDELSGGQRQRVGIARALSIGPRIIVADEPVSSLDVSVQAQVINLLCDLRDTFGVGLVLVAHDLAVAWHIADEIAVMFSGRIVERGPAEEILRWPRHPYTATLLAAVPGQGARNARNRRPAAAADAIDRPSGGCRFRHRCPIGPAVNPERSICREVDPQLDGSAAHGVACHFASDLAAAQTLSSPLGNPTMELR